MIRAQRNSVRIGFGFITRSLLVPEVVAGVGRMAGLFRGHVTKVAIDVKTKEDSLLGEQSGGVVLQSIFRFRPPTAACT